MRLPSNQISPLLIRVSLVIARMVLVLPAPLAPISAMVSPCSSLSDTPFSADTLS